MRNTSTTDCFSTMSDGCAARPVGTWAPFPTSADPADERHLTAGLFKQHGSNQLRHRQHRHWSAGAQGQADGGLETLAEATQTAAVGAAWIDQQWPGRRHRPTNRRPSPGRCLLLSKTTRAAVDSIDAFRAWSAARAGAEPVAARTSSFVSRKATPTIAAPLAGEPRHGRSTSSSHRHPEKRLIVASASS